MTSRNGIHSCLDLSEKGKLWSSTLSHNMCPRKQTTEPKLLIFVYFFSGEVTSYTDIIASTYCRKCAVPFLLATLYSALLLNSRHINCIQGRKQCLTSSANLVIVSVLKFFIAMLVWLFTKWELICTKPVIPKAEHFVKMQYTVL